MRRMPATASIFWPAFSKTARPNARPKKPRSAETVTCPNPQRKVTRAVFAADHLWVRARAAKGTQ